MENNPKSPFKFLDSYAKEDNSTFFGRDDETEELYYRVFKSKILILFGVSGIGKSSLINCGLANKIQESDWFPVPVRRGPDINQTLKKTLQKCLITPLPETANESIPELIKSIFFDHFKPVYIIFDQFEELFIFGNDQEWNEFIETVQSIVKSNVQCRLIFSVREEYLASLTVFEKKIPDFLSNRLRINPITQHNAMQIIEGLCRAHDIPMEEGCANAILNELSADRSEIDLTYLQIFLDRLYRLALEEHKATGNIYFSKQLVKKAGSVKDILGSFLENEISRFNDQDKETALRILKAFVSVKGTKRQVSAEEILDDIKQPGTKADLQIITTLVQKFVALRIVKDIDENGKYELRHDSLAARIFEKITISEKEVNEIKNIIQNAYDQYVKRGILLNERDLKDINPYLEKLFLNRDKKDFILKSRKEIQLKRKRIRTLGVAMLFLLLLTMTGFTIWALLERNKANKIAKVATANAFASYSLLTTDKNPTLSFRLAEKAFQTDPNHLAMEALSLSYETAAYNPFYTDLKGHSSDVINCDYTPHGRNVVTASLDGTARIWDMKGNELCILTGHSGNLFSAGFSPDGRYVLTASNDSTIRLWERDGKLLNIIKDKDERNFMAVFSPDGNFIISASLSGVATIWKFNPDKKNISRLHYLTGHGAQINCIRVSDDMKHIATASVDMTARIWNFDGTCVSVLKGHSAEVFDVGFSPDNTRVVTSSDDKTARIWDLKGKELKIFANHTSPVSKCVFTPDGRYIISVSDDGTAVIHEGAMTKVVKTNIGCINCLDISPDSKFFAIGSESGIAQVYNMNGELWYELKGHNAPVWSICYAGSTDTILTASGDGTAKIWILKNAECEVIDKKISSTVYSHISEKEKILLVMNENNSLSFFDIQKNLLIDFKYQGAGMKANMTPDNTMVATSSYDRTARIWDTSGKEIMRYNHALEVESTEFSPDGKTLLTACYDGAARIWDFTGKMTREFHADTVELACASFSHDGKRIITGSLSTAAIIWNLDGTLVRELKMHTAAISCAKFSPDGEYILTASSDGSAILWNADGMYIKAMESIHRTAIREVGFSADSRYFFTLSQKPYMVLVWSRQGELLNIINLGDAPDREHFAQFSDDGKSLLVITGTRNKIYIKKWPLQTKDIMTNVNEKHLLGNIPLLTEDEVKSSFNY